MIQEQANGLAVGRRTRQQHQRDLPVIILNPIALLTVDGSLQAAGALRWVPPT